MRARTAIVVLIGALALAGQAGAASPVQTITVVNRAGVSAAAVNRAITALTVQVNHDLRRYWPGPSVVLKSAPRSQGERLILARDWGTVRGVQLIGGFHDVTSGGVPFAVVDFASLQGSWTVLASHELLEMLVDAHPFVILNGLGLEICDPAEQVTYTINGVRVADFVTPSWFERGNWPWDDRGVLKSAATPN